MKLVIVVSNVINVQETIALLLITPKESEEGGNIGIRNKASQTCWPCQ